MSDLIRPPGGKPSTPQVGGESTDDGEDKLSQPADYVPQTGQGDSQYSCK